MTDPRLSDDRVKAARKPRFLIGEDEWPDAPSVLDVLDARPSVDDTLLPPARPVRADSLIDFGKPVIQQSSDWSQVIRYSVIWFSAVVIVASCVGFGYWVRMVTS